LNIAPITKYYVLIGMIDVLVSLKSFERVFVFCSIGVVMKEMPDC